MAVSEMSSDHISEVSQNRKRYRPGARRMWFNRYGSGLVTHEPPPLPYGCPDDIDLFWDETPEQRAFRRFPIKSHKPLK
jgi:hypothetical protein